jgi:hypothetical protein
MDFITGLPKSGNKLVIMVVVDFLSKYAHFCALHHPFTTSTMAQIFMEQVFNIHGIPHSIVCSIGGFPLEEACELFFLNITPL